MRGVIGGTVVLLVVAAACIALGVATVEWVPAGLGAVVSGLSAWACGSACHIHRNARRAIAALQARVRELEAQLPTQAE